MKVLTIDIETASVENIKECGVYRYAESEFFDLLLVSYSVDGDAVATIDIANGDTIPDEILSAFTDKSIIKKAFNVNFERVCLSIYLRRNYPDLAGIENSVGNYIDPESWQCDMIHSRYLGMMSSLDDMGKLLRLKEKKLSEGKDLIKFFCTLHEDKKGNFLFHDKSDAPKKWKEFIEYNRRDVEVELKIQRLLSEMPVPNFIWEEFYIDQRINDRGIRVDTQFAAKAVELDNNVKTELFPKLKELTNLDNPNSPSGSVNIKPILREVNERYGIIPLDEEERVVVPKNRKDKATLHCLCHSFDAVAVNDVLMLDKLNGYV